MASEASSRLAVYKPFSKSESRGSLLNAWLRKRKCGANRRLRLFCRKNNEPGAESLDSQ